MSTPKRFFWMKLKDSFMFSDTVDYFMSMPEGANYVVLYQLLCLKTINTDGRLSRTIGEITIPYDVEKIRRDLKWFSADTIRVALNLYKAVGLIYEDADGTLVLSDHVNLVGSETSSAQIKRNAKESGLPRLTSGVAKRVNRECIKLPDGKIQYIDEKRYGNNGALAFDNAGCICERCGASDNLVIHHNNGYSNEIYDLLVLCRSCHATVHNENEDGRVDDNLLKYRNYGKRTARAVESEVEEGVEIFHPEKEIDIRDKSIEIDSRSKRVSKVSSIKKELDSFCTEPQSSSVLELLLNDKSNFAITQANVDEWKELYPAVDVMQELRNMKGWIKANPTRRKTRGGINRFINAWLAKAQNRGGSSGLSAQRLGSSTSFSDIAKTIAEEAQDDN